MTFHTFADGTMIKISSIDVIGSIIPESEIPEYSPIPTNVPQGSYVYRIITLGFAGAGGSLSLNPLLRVSLDLQALTAEREALITAVTSA